MSKTPVKTTPVKIALRRFVAETGEVIEEGERVHPDHDVIRLHPENFRSRELSEELQIRSERVADLNSRDFSAKAAQPLSRAGVAEREELRFWNQVDRDLTRDDSTSAERAEQSIFDEGLRQLERLDEARLAEETDQFRSMWAGRLPLER